MPEKNFSIANALKSLRTPSTFKRFQKQVLSAAKVKKNAKKVGKVTGGYLIPVEFSKYILLGVAINNWKVTKRLSKADLITLVEDWERTNEANKRHRDTITVLEKALKWYKQRHKTKKKK